MDIKRMLSDLRAERERIDKAIAALQQLDSTPSHATAQAGRPAAKKSAIAFVQPKRGRRKMSAAARKAMSEAAKKRWVERKGSRPTPQASAKQTARTQTTPKGRTRGMSAAGRRRISMMMKKRWAEKKKAAAKAA